MSAVAINMLITTRHSLRFREAASTTARQGVNIESPVRAVFHTA